MKQERKKIKNFVTHCQQVNNVMTHIKGKKEQSLLFCHQFVSFCLRRKLVIISVTPMTSNDYIYIGIMERKPIVQEYKPR